MEETLLESGDLALQVQPETQHMPEAQDCPLLAQQLDDIGARLQKLVPLFNARYPEEKYATHFDYHGTFFRAYKVTASRMAKVPTSKGQRPAGSESLDTTSTVLSNNSNPSHNPGPRRPGLKIDFKSLKSTSQPPAPSCTPSNPPQIPENVDITPQSQSTAQQQQSSTSHKPPTSTQPIQNLSRFAPLSQPTPLPLRVPLVNYSSQATPETAGSMPAGSSQLCREGQLVSERVAASHAKSPLTPAPPQLLESHSTAPKQAQQTAPHEDNTTTPRAATLMVCVQEPGMLVQVTQTCAVAQTADEHHSSLVKPKPCSSGGDTDMCRNHGADEQQAGAQQQSSLVSKPVSCLGELQPEHLSLHSKVKLSSPQLLQTSLNSCPDVSELEQSRPACNIAHEEQSVASLSLASKERIASQLTYKHSPHHGTSWHTGQASTDSQTPIDQQASAVSPLNAQQPLAAHEQHPHTGRFQTSQQLPDEKQTSPTAIPSIHPTVAGVSLQHNTDTSPITAVQFTDGRRDDDHEQQLPHVHSPQQTVGQGLTVLTDLSPVPPSDHLLSLAKSDRALSTSPAPGTGPLPEAHAPCPFAHSDRVQSASPEPSHPRQTAHQSSLAMLGKGPSRICPLESGELPVTASIVALTAAHVHVVDSQEKASPGPAQTLQQAVAVSTPTSPPRFSHTSAEPHLQQPPLDQPVTTKPTMSLQHSESGEIPACTGDAETSKGHQPAVTSAVTKHWLHKQPTGCRWGLPQGGLLDQAQYLVNRLQKERNWLNSRDRHERLRRDDTRTKHRKRSRSAQRRRRSRSRSPRRHSRQRSGLRYRSRSRSRPGRDSRSPPPRRVERRYSSSNLAHSSRRSTKSPTRSPSVTERQQHHSPRSHRQPCRQLTTKASDPVAQSTPARVSQRSTPEPEACPAAAAAELQPSAMQSRSHAQSGQQYGADMDSPLLTGPSGGKLTHDDKVNLAIARLQADSAREHSKREQAPTPTPQQQPLQASTNQKRPQIDDMAASAKRQRQEVSIQPLDNLPPTSSPPPPRASTPEPVLGPFPDPEDMELDAHMGGEVPDHPNDKRCGDDAPLERGMHSDPLSFIAVSMIKFSTQYATHVYTKAQIGALQADGRRIKRAADDIVVRLKMWTPIALLDYIKSSLKYIEAAYAYEQCNERDMGLRLLKDTCVMLEMVSNQCRSQLRLAAAEPATADAARVRQLQALRITATKLTATCRMKWLTISQDALQRAIQAIEPVATAAATTTGRVPPPQPSTGSMDGLRAVTQPAASSAPSSGLNTSAPTGASDDHKGPSPGADSASSTLDGVHSMSVAAWVAHLQQLSDCMTQFSKASELWQAAATEAVEFHNRVNEDLGAREAHVAAASIMALGYEGGAWDLLGAVQLGNRVSAALERLITAGDSGAQPN